MKKIIFLIIMLVLMSTSVFGLNSQISVTDNIVVNKTQLDNRYLVANQIDVQSDVDGDLFGVGSFISVNGTISDDLNLIGSKIKVVGTIGEDLRMVGSDLYLDAIVFKEMLLVGQRIIVAPESKIGHDAYLEGNVIDVEGEFSKDVSIRGESVYFNGLVQGNLELNANSLKIGPDALVVGNLKLSDNLNFDKSLVRGDIVKVAKKDFNPEKESGISIGTLLMIFVMLLIVGFVFLAVPKEYAKRVEITSMQRPFHSFVVGLIATVLSPLAIFVLLWTVIGIPLGVILSMAYLGLVILSMPVGAWFLGGMILKVFDMDVYKYMKLVLGAIAFVLIGLIPVVGPIILLITSIIGFGAMVRNFYGKDKPKRRTKRRKRRAVVKKAKSSSLKKPSKPKSLKSKKANK